jgi:GT2 family glycosyltransferase
MEKCSIIIPAYNEAANLKRCLESLAQLDYPKQDYEIIVINNNSTDNTEEIIHQFKDVVYLKEERKGGSFARNRGMQYAMHNILVFLDADTAVSQSWLKNLINPFSDKTIGAVGGEIRPLRARNIISEYLAISLFMRYHRYGKRREIKGYPSCNLAVRKELIEKGFDTDVFSTYGEDKDLCYQILKKGFKIIFQPGAIIYHQHPEILQELVVLFVKSSTGRVNFSKKYPAAPDIILFNFHIPLLYAAGILLSLIFKNVLLFFVLMAPLGMYILIAGVSAFIKSRRFILSFIIKPILDVISVYVIYAVYHYYKISKGCH